MKTKVNGYVEEKQAKKQTNTYTHTHTQTENKEKERKTYGWKTSIKFLPHIVKTWNPKKERRKNPEALYISLSVSLCILWFCLYIHKQKQSKKEEKNKAEDKDQNGPTLKRHD